MRVAGKADAILDLVGGYSTHWSFYVVPKFAHGVLLGNDFLEHSGAVLNFKRLTLSLEGSPPILSWCEEGKLKCLSWDRTKLSQLGAQ